MNITHFLYSFAKIYIPAALLLCMFYVATHDKVKMPEVKNVVPSRVVEPKINIPQQQPGLQKQMPSPHVVIPQSTTKPKQNSEIKPDIFEKPKPYQNPTVKYYYEVELASGKFMKVDHVTEREGVITLTVEKGFSIKLPRSEIKSIKRYRL